MFEFISYQNTPAGKIQLDSEGLGSTLVETLSVVAGEAGIYDVQAQGRLPEVGWYLYLPVKGARNVSLKLQVLGISELISPSGAWQANCQGPLIKEFNLRSLDMCCDECNEISQVEFIEYSGNVEKDAIQALNQQGWLASTERQVCPNCLKSVH